MDSRNINTPAVVLLVRGWLWLTHVAGIMIALASPFTPSDIPVPGKVGMVL